MFLDCLSHVDFSYWLCKIHMRKSIQKTYSHLYLNDICMLELNLKICYSKKIGHRLKCTSKTRDRKMTDTTNRYSHTYTMLWNQYTCCIDALTSYICNNNDIEYKILQQKRAPIKAITTHCYWKQYDIWAFTYSRSSRLPSCIRHSGRLNFQHCLFEICTIDLISLAMVILQSINRIF